MESCFKAFACALHAACCTGCAGDACRGYKAYVRKLHDVAKISGTGPPPCLKATARHTLHRLEIMTPQAIHTHTARRAKSEAASEADFDEHRWDVRAFGCVGHDGRAP